MRRAFFIWCFLLAFALQLSAQFAPHVDYPTGQEPWGVAVGDFNGDRKLDLAVTNSSDNTVGVLLGNGDGTFQPQVAYATGSRPLSVSVGDFNGDGKLDLAITSAADNTVSILLGRGDGTFWPHVDYAVGDINPQWLVVADFNHDGKLDIATANYGPNYSNGTVSILLGNGDGTFQAPRTYSAGINPFGVMTGDFNHDGIPDLAVVNNNGYFGVQILLGNGDGSFQSPVFYATGENPRVGVVADLNGDGNLDLAIGNCIDNDLSILMGDGAGHFASPVNYATGNYVSTLASGDFNGDGKLDLVNTDAESNSVSVLLGNGDGTFQAHVDYATGSDPSWVAVGDFNGDGAPDLVTTNLVGNTVSILLNIFRATTTTLAAFPNNAGPHQLVIYDAAVSSPSGSAVTGSITFKDGGVALATVMLENHLAAWSTRYSTVGSHAITATYSGDADNNSSTSSPLMENIVGASKTFLTTSGSPSFVGRQVTFTATVSSLYGVIPNGEMVTFYEGATTLGTGAITAGVATLTTSALTAKPQTIKATYAGDATFKTSSGTVPQVVEKYATTTGLTSNINPSNYGETVTFTTTVTSAGPAPTGKVWFRDGTTGIAAVTLSGGVGSITKSKLAVGTHSITAEYLGDADNAKSTSPVLDQVVQ